MSFKDKSGREFVAVLTLPVQIQLKKNGLDIGLPFTDMLKLLADPELLANVLYIVHQDSAAALGVSDVEFGKLLDGDTLASASESLLDAIVNFSPPTLRSAYQELLRKSRATESRLGAEMLAAVNKVEVESILNEFAGNSQASSA